jgi:MFS family permease
METAVEGETARHVDTRRWWTLAVFGFIVLQGAGLQMRGAVIPVLERTFGAPAWQLGLVAPAGTVGFTLSVALVGWVAGRFGTHRLLLVGVLGAGAGLFTMGLAPSFAFFLVALLGQGALSGVGRGSDRPLLSHLYPRKRGRLFSYYDMMWAVGATTGPLVVSAALWLGDWRLAFYALGLAFVPVAALVWSLPAPEVDGGDDPLDLAELRRIGRRPEVLVMVAVITLTVGVEGGLFTWLTTFAAGRLPESLAPVVLSVLLVAYIPGRFTAGRLAERVGYVTLALVLVLVCLAATLYTFFLATGFGLVAGLFVVGFSLSGLYPTLLAYATEAVPEHSAALNAMALVVGAVAIAGVPFAMGFVIDASGIATAMRLLVLPLAVMAMVVGAIRVRA